MTATLNAQKLHKVFKKKATKNASSLTLAEQGSNLSAAKAVDTLLSRAASSHESNSNFGDVLNAFSTGDDQPRSAVIPQMAKQKRRKQTQKQPKSNIEYLDKAKDGKQSAASSNKTNTKQPQPRPQKRLLSEHDHDDTNEPPSKKQKTSSMTATVNDNDDDNDLDYYTQHWNTRYEDKTADVLPVARQHRAKMMQTMDLSPWLRRIRHKQNRHLKEIVCFIDHDASAFPISASIDAAALHCHGDVVAGYAHHRKEKHAQTDTDSKLHHRLSPLDALLLSAVSTYRDVLFCARNWRNNESVKQVLSAHLLSHVLNKKKVQSENDVCLQQQSIANAVGDDGEDGRVRDRGFNPLCVLVVTPFKRSVWQYMQSVLSLLPAARKLSHQRYKRFAREYEFRLDESLRGRGMEHMVTFSGDTDDDFECAVSIAEKGVCFMHSRWDEADILFISPLRLKMMMSATTTDLLSSVEVCVMDECDVIEMQNMKHLLDSMDKLNRSPTLKQEDDLKRVHFDRLRFCFIDSVSKWYRQNIVVSKHQTPQIRRLFEEHCVNVFGRIKIDRRYSNGVLEKVIPSVRQEFYRFCCVDGEQEDKDEDVNDKRLQVYKKYMLPIFRRNNNVKTLIFVSSYYDFLRLRSLYKAVQNESIQFLSEYTDDSEARKYRRQFNDASNDKLMYLVITERYFFYNRVRCKGAQRILFYSLPMSHDYYYEILNWLDTKKQYESYAIYAQHFDNLTLQRIVGLQRMMRMLSNTNRTQVFV